MKSNFPSPDPDDPPAMYPPARARFSLLWPPGDLTASGQNTSQLSLVAWHNLGLDHVVEAFTPDGEHQKEVARILCTLCQDPAAILYRQDVIDDLLRSPQLADRLEALLPTIDTLGRFSHRVVKDMNTLHEVTWRMGELQSIVDCIQGLSEVFQTVGTAITSRGLIAFREEIVRTQNDATYQNLVSELPEMLSQLRTCASVTIGVNLDQFLRPVEATLLSVNEDKFTDQSLLNRLFGIKSGTKGLVPLHTVPRREVSGQYALPISSELGWAVEPMMVPLFADLAKVIEKTTQPIARELKRYAQIRSEVFVHLRQELIFYLGALRFLRRIQKTGMPMCRPTLATAGERAYEVDETYNINLALRMSQSAPEQGLREAITCNDVSIGPESGIQIITGPNQGGKTTYMQGVGILQVLAQVGLPVPGSRARISPVDQIFTHFPIEEKPEAETGRFGEEAKRLGEIFKYVTRHSLVLLNESLSSTSAGESLYLAQDLVRILRRIGARALYSTHLHELAEQVVELNAGVPGDITVISVVSSPVDGKQPWAEGALPGYKRSYKLEVRPPLGRSYAHDIAARYGVSYDQLEKILIDRGVLEKGTNGDTE